MVKNDLVLSCGEKRLYPVSDPVIPGWRIATNDHILESQRNKECNISTVGSTSDYALLLNNARLQLYGVLPERKDK